MNDVDAQVSHADGDVEAQEQLHAGHGPHHAHHHGHESHDHEEPMTPEEVVSSLLLLAQVALDAGDYESAAEAYASILQLESNETASYNLGSFRARGVGVKRDFMEAARLFHQAELLGNARAGQLCRKCMLDYLNEGLEEKAPVDLYAAMAVFVSRVYPEATDSKQEVNSGLIAVASTFFSKGWYAAAAKVFRSAAEFGNDGYAQYYLGELYDAGAGLQKNDLAALYWFDCAVDNGAADDALAYRDGMLAAWRQSLSAPEFRELMETLADWCESGTSDVPTNPAKAARWREIA